jgi:hypothetical protein
MPSTNVEASEEIKSKVGRPKKRGRKPSRSTRATKRTKQKRSGSVTSKRESIDRAANILEQLQALEEEKNQAIAELLEEKRVIEEQLRIFGYGVEVSKSKRGRPKGSTSGKKKRGRPRKEQSEAAQA